MTPVVINELDKFSLICRDVRSKEMRIGLVPTMGALHDGHMALVREAKKRSEWVALTIFVNPLQFNVVDDLLRYPKTLNEDIQKCAEAGVDCVFAPFSESMYPPNFSSYVSVDNLSTRYEGEYRPQHFRGVTTIVTKLFNLCGPCIAVFGQKDYQQWKIIEKMVHDLNMPIEVIGLPTIRENDGLALSSRNRHLSTEERRRSVAIFQGLQAAENAWQLGERSFENLMQATKKPIEEAFDRVDYISIANLDTLEPIEGHVEKGVILIAAWLGNTRLIDNHKLGTPI